MIMSQQESDRTQTNSSASGIKRWREWQWWLPYVGAIVPVLILAGSLLTFTIRFTLDAYKWLVWKDSLDVITFSSIAPQAFLNSGDGEIFVSHVEVRGSVFSQVIPINGVVKSKEFLSVPVSPHSSMVVGKSIVETDSEQQWKDFLANKIAKHDPSYVPVIYFANSPELQLYKTALKEKLRTFKADANLVYYTSKGQRISTPVPVEGVVFGSDSQPSPSPSP
jgi:hypothetical protein